jgi:hypothetical protein
MSESSNRLSVGIWMLVIQCNDEEKNAKSKRESSFCSRNQSRRRDLSAGSGVP